MNLPVSFEERMKKLLGEEFPRFLASFHDPRHYGLRINTLKWSVEEAKKKLPFQLSPIGWVEEGFTYTEEIRPGKHPYYHAGLYYIQEPSAMAPAAIIPVKPGDRVLDLCAAPGGKSTQLAAKLQGEGLLVSNDTNAERVKPLLKNIELSGIRNAVVTNETPDRLAKVFPAYFDCILIDAPCSGEGMFRKDKDMMKNWEEEHVGMYATMQKDILHEAAKMLRIGGSILYSTCTFAPEENESQIARFLNEHPEFELEIIPANNGFQQGKATWTETAWPMEKTVRLWPHHLQGEGHYVALLKKTKENDRESTDEVQQDGSRDLRREKGRESHPSEKELGVFREFEQDVLTRPIVDMVKGELSIIKTHLYVRPHGLPSLQGLKVVKSGWYLGEQKKNRFEPSQALAMGLRANEVRETINFSVDDDDLIRYLKGETIHCDGIKGWRLMTVDGFPLGWAKQVQGFLKNAYPPGWRWLA
jgi:NOL1/NOP2/sun family putative RNA methylase